MMVKSGLGAFLVSVCSYEFFNIDLLYEMASELSAPSLLRANGPSGSMARALSRQMRVAVFGQERSTDVSTELQIP